MLLCLQSCGKTASSTVQSKSYKLWYGLHGTDPAVMRFFLYLPGIMEFVNIG